MNLKFRDLSALDWSRMDLVQSLTDSYQGIFVPGHVSAYRPVGTGLINFDPRVCLPTILKAIVLYRARYPDSKLEYLVSDKCLPATLDHPDKSHMQSCSLHVRLKAEHRLAEQFGSQRLTPMAVTKASERLSECFKDLGGMPTTPRHHEEAQTC